MGDTLICFGVNHSITAIININTKPSIVKYPAVRSCAILPSVQTHEQHHKSIVKLCVHVGQAVVVLLAHFDIHEKHIYAWPGRRVNRDILIINRRRSVQVRFHRGIFIALIELCLLSFLSLLSIYFLLFSMFLLSEQAPTTHSYNRTLVYI